MRASIALILLLLLGSLFGQTEVTTAVPEPEKDQSPDYQLGPGDGLQITLVCFPNLSLKNVSVSNSGKIHLPYLGIIPVAGMTSIELETELRNRLMRQKLVRDPQVQVTVTLYRAQPVYILGEVGMPGQYVLREKAYLMDLLTWAAGVNDVARDYGFLYRRNPKYRIPEPGSKEPPSKEPLYTVTKIDLKPLLAGKGDLKLDLVLQGGDLFHVPKRAGRFFYIVGEVNKTGAFGIPEGGEPLLVSRALSSAGGPMRTAKLSKGVLVRSDESGHREEIRLDFGAIFKGKKPDFPVQDNDIIFIPGSQIKTIAMGLAGILPSVAERTAYAHTGIGGGP